MKSYDSGLGHRLRVLTAATGIFLLAYPAVTAGTQLKPMDLNELVALELIDGVAPGGGDFPATGEALPLSLASADLDKDGIADLVVGSGLAGGGVLTIYPGNRHAIYPHSNAPVTADTPFRKALASIASSTIPEFLAAGDFTGDGHGDLITAATGSGVLEVFRGLGNGRFEDPTTVELGGRLTALASGEIHRRDGVVDLVAAIDSADGPSLLIFSDPRGALQKSAIRQALPASATQLVLGSFDGDPAHDLALVAGSHLWVKVGSMSGRSSAIEAVSRTESVLAIADAGGRLGVLSSNGDVDLMTSSRSDLKDGTGHVWQNATIARIEKTKIGGGHWRLTSCRLSTAPTPDLLIHDLSTGRLRVVMTALPVDPPEDIVPLVAPVARTVAELTTLSGWSPAEPNPVVLGSPSNTTDYDLGAVAAATLPMRLSPDALDDLVFLPRSEAIPRVLKSGPRATFTVSSTGDEEDALIGDGICETAVLSCTLRAAISETNFTADLDTIEFLIPAASDPGCDPTSGICTIQVGAAGLATLIYPVVLDATTQPGFAITPLIELDGSLTGANVTGFAVWGGGTTVRGFAINRFPNNSDILAWNLGNNIIEGNFLGTDPAGTANVGSLNSLHISGITGTTVGGTTAEARNLISGNSGPAFAFNNGAFDNLAQGNTFGLDESGTIGLGNLGNDLLVMNGSTGNTIGGTTVGAGNTIVANQASDFPSLGVAYDSSANLIQGNFIGTNFFGDELGNLGIAVSIVDAPDNTIGGAVPGAGNVIAYNGSGIDLRGDTNIGITITGNSIHSNDFLGIDLCADEDPTTGSCLDPANVTPNDPADPDTGTNNLQNFPVLVSVDRVAAGVDGTLDSIPSSAFTIDLYVNTNCDPTNYGEGETFVGSIPVTTDATRAASFTMSLPASPVAGTYLTATATDDGGSTSEFSMCLEVPPAADLGLGKFGFVSAVAPGDTLTYILDLTNNGPDDASGVVITDVLPLDAVFSAASPQCNHVAGTVTCTVGDLASGGSVSASIDVVVGTPPGSELVNTATVSGTEADPNPADNSAAETTGVDASLIFADGFENGTTGAWSANAP